MKFEINDEFIVIEKKPYTGLTFGEHVVPFGTKFRFKDWPYTEAMLEAAIKDERVKEIKAEKKEEPAKKERVEEKKEKAEDKKAEKKKIGIQRKIDNLMEKYTKVDPESDDAKGIAEEVEKLEAELKEVS